MHLNSRLPNGDTCQGEVPFYYIILVLVFGHNNHENRELWNWIPKNFLN